MSDPSRSDRDRRARLSNMATNIPLISGEREDNYELELSRVREKIKSTFVEFIVSLKARESELLRELDNILASYLSYRSELERVNEKRIALETMIHFHQNQIPNSPVKSVHEDSIARTTTELKSIETPTEPQMVTFECDSYKMLTELNKLGKFVEKLKIGTDYTSKNQPLVSVCEKGSEMHQLDSPIGVTVNNRTGNIYISDQGNNCIKIFDLTGIYLFKFGDNEGEGEMYRPRGVAICGDRILITEGNDHIMCYGLNGICISNFGKHGGRKSNFNNPSGLTIDELHGHIYICDTENNRIQIFNSNFSFKSQLGKRVDYSNPCLHLFNYNHILLKSVIDRCGLFSPTSFFIDQTNNILISFNNSINIFNAEFQLIHKIPISIYAKGVSVDKQGRVVVVRVADEDCLQIYSENFCSYLYFIFVIASFCSG